MTSVRACPLTELRFWVLHWSRPKTVAPPRLRPRWSAARNRTRSRPGGAPRATNCWISPKICAFPAYQSTNAARYPVWPEASVEREGVQHYGAADPGVVYRREHRHLYGIERGGPRAVAVPAARPAGLPLQHLPPEGGHRPGFERGPGLLRSQADGRRFRLRGRGKGCRLRRG